MAKFFDKKLQSNIVDFIRNYDAELNEFKISLQKQNLSIKVIELIE
jgi:hypothetical protein